MVINYRYINILLSEILEILYLKGALLYLKGVFVIVAQLVAVFLGA